jgi:hypothetical protein
MTYVEAQDVHGNKLHPTKGKGLGLGSHALPPHRSARADGEEEGVGRVAKLEPSGSLHPRNCLQDLIPKTIWQALACCMELATNLGAYDKACWHVEPQACHLAEVGTLAAKLQGLPKSEEKGVQEGVSEHVAGWKLYTKTKPGQSVPSILTHEMFHALISRRGALAERINAPGLRRLRWVVGLGIHAQASDAAPTPQTLGKSLTSTD